MLIINDIVWFFLCSSSKSNLQHEESRPPLDNSKNKIKTRNTISYYKPNRTKKNKKCNKKTGSNMFSIYQKKIIEKSKKEQAIRICLNFESCWCCCSNCKKSLLNKCQQQTEQHTGATFFTCFSRQLLLLQLIFLLRFL